MDDTQFLQDRIPQEPSQGGKDTIGRLCQVDIRDTRYLLHENEAGCFRHPLSWLYHASQRIPGEFLARQRQLAVKGWSEQPRQGTTTRKGLMQWTLWALMLLLVGTRSQQYQVILGKRLFLLILGSFRRCG